MHYKTIILALIVSNSAIASELSLNEYLNQVKERSLGLKQEEAKFNSVESTASLGIRLPPPNLGFTQQNEDHGVISNGFEISQEIPFPTKLTSDYSARKYEALAQKEMLHSSYNEILSKAKLAYIDLWVAQEQLGLLNEKTNILEQHLRLSRSAVRSDSFLSVHLLKAESDRDFLENEVIGAQQKIREKQIVLAEIINEDINSFKPIVAEPELSRIPEKFNLDETPHLGIYRYMLESFKERETTAKSAWLPDFSLKYKEMGANTTTNRYNEIMLGVTLPFLYFWEPNSEVKKAKSESLQAELSLSREKKNLEAKIISLYVKAESLLKQIENLKNKLIPRAEKRMRLVHNLAPRDMETITDHRETMEAFPNLKMNELDLRLQYEEVVSELEKHISKGLYHE